VSHKASDIQRIKTDRTGQTNTLGLINALTAWDLVDLAYTHGFHHLVHKAQPDTMREIRTARLMNQTPEIFFQCPLSSVLAPRIASPQTEKDVTLLEWPLAKHADKEVILASIDQIFDEAMLNESLREDVVLVADEFICNALFNATQTGGINNNNLETAIRLAQRPMSQPATVRMGAHNGYLAISCKDNYGTLDPQRFLSRLHTCLKQGAGEAINLEDRGTAGIGGFMVFNACTSLYMAVEGGKATMFCALFPLRSGAKERSLRPKNLHWLSY
jgi:hypothetical protein